MKNQKLTVIERAAIRLNDQQKGFELLRRFGDEKVRLMSFAMTIRQMKNQIKTVTRRHTAKHINEDDLILAVEKARGVRVEDRREIAVLRVDDESKFGEAARVLRDQDAKTTMMLFDQYAGVIEFYFVSETPSIGGAVGKAIFTDPAAARQKLIELNGGKPEDRFFSPNRLQIYQFTGNGIIQPLKAKRRLMKPDGETARSYTGNREDFTIFNHIQTMARLFELVHAGQDSGELVKIKDLSKALGINQKTVRCLCDDAGFNINVAIKAGEGVSELAEGDHTVEHLEYVPIKAK
jgi:hypothetical protein